MPKKNRILDYLSAVHSTLESLAVDADTDLMEEDDGESHSVNEGKEAALFRIDASIAQLQQLRVDVQNKTHAEFCQKHGLMQE
jgi:hypothetical protein